MALRTDWMPREQKPSSNHNIKVIIRATGHAHQDASTREHLHTPPAHSTSTRQQLTPAHKETHTNEFETKIGKT